MIRPSSTYLLKHKKNFKDDKEVYQFLLKSFPELNADSSYGSFFNFVFSMLTHIAHPISMNQLNAFFGNDFIHRQKIKRMVDKGLLKIYKMPKEDKGSRNAYSLTPVGTNTLFYSLPLDLFDRSKIRRTGGLLHEHDYGVGLSLLQCLLRETPFYYQKEVLYSPGLVKVKGSICADAAVCFSDEQENLIYIEQDMGTEKIPAICKKLHFYDAYGLLQGGGRHLVISSHAIVNVHCPSFNARALEEVIQDMEERGANLLYYYYVTYGVELSERLRNSIRALLVRTQVCNCFRSNGTPLDASEIIETNELERDLRVNDLTLEDLRSYVGSLKDGNNEYKEAAYNKKQHSVAYHKMERMAKHIGDLILDGQSLRGEAQLLLKGHSCYVLPTVLLSNYFETITGEDMGSLLSTLSHYFPGLETATYSTLSDVIAHESYPSLQLRNCYRLADGTYVCVENTGKDLGAYVRAAYLNVLRQMGLQENIHVVCICDTQKEAMSMAAVLDYYPKVRDLETKGITYSFLLSEDIGSAEGLCMPSRLGGGCLLPVKPFVASTATPVPSSEKNALEELEGMSMEELMNLV